MVIDIKSLISTAVFILGALPALCEPDFSAPYPNLGRHPKICDNPFSLTRDFAERCAYQNAKGADERLNTVYQQVISVLSIKERKQLINTQQAWINYRDATCEQYQTPSFKKQNGLSAYYECIKEMTEKRVSELEND